MSNHLLHRQVHGLAFHPSLLLVATAGEDSKFKLWEGVAPPAAAAGAAEVTADEAGAAGAGPGDELATSMARRAAAPLPHGASGTARWACRSVGYYRMTPASAVAFSADGSLLAVTYNPDLVTLWDPITNELLHTLCQPLPSPADELCFVAFSGEGGTLLTHSSRAVMCWHLLSGALAWSYTASTICAAAVDPQSDALLVSIGVTQPAEAGAAGGGEGGEGGGGGGVALRHVLLEFCASAPAAPEDGKGAADSAALPRRIWQLGGGAPRALGFLPAAAGSAGTPICLTHSGEMHALAEGGAEGGAEGAARGGAVSAAGGTSLARLGGASRLETIFGATPSSDLARIAVAAPRAGVDETGGGAAPFGGAGRASDDASLGWEARAIDGWIRAQISAVPSHLLPPVSTIFSSVVPLVLAPAPRAGGGEEAGGGEAGGRAKPRPSELRMALSAQARREGTLAELKAAVAEYAPLLQGRHASAEAARKNSKKLRKLAKAAVGRAARLAEESEARAMARRESGAGEGEGEEEEEEGEEEEDDEEEDERGDGAAPLSGGGGREPHARSVRGPEGGDEEGEGPEGKRSKRSPAETAPTSDAAAAAAAAAAPLAGEARGHTLLDMAGLPNPGHLVRDYAGAPPPAWDSSKGAPSRDGGTRLSAADLAFWHENAYDEPGLAELEDWMGAEGEGPEADGAEGGRLVAPRPIDPDLEAMLGGMSLPGVAGGDLAAEIREAVAALADGGLSLDSARGHGAAPRFPAEMRQRQPAGWQAEPSKGEWKELAKVYRGRRAAGESRAELSVLEAGLRASGCRPALKIVDACD